MVSVWPIKNKMKTFRHPYLYMGLKNNPQVPVYGFKKCSEFNNFKLFYNYSD